ncbi:proline--tRNA ligase [Candidatus Peregrinibacteria bacterium]|nr:proline--tRNA ligase [Candidatus Peregrinibacteria bacterium]
MLYSQLFGKTQKEIPKDVVVKSHEYLVRGGFIYQLAAGLYDFLPLGYRVLMKIDQIVKEELAKKGVQHLLMPLVHPASLWKESGRYDKIDVLLKFTTARGHDAVLAPTHEETVTDLARKYLKTYKDLPVILNQNQWKYRDEIRATGGLLRTREFLMQDAYSFDRDQKGLDLSFAKVSEAYHAIFDRIGLDVTVVKADSGTMGGSDSEEFMVISNVGEDDILACDSCEYRANSEKAESRFEVYEQDKEMKEMERVHGSGIIGVEELAKHLGVPVYSTTKTLLFQADDRVVATLVRGDYDFSETKLKNYLACTNLALASPDVVKNLTGAAVGYAGPVNLPKDVLIVADLTCKGRVNFEAGANETDYHNLNVNFERDFPTPEFVDLREARDGDGCPRCEGKLQVRKAIEVGHVFKLGRAYSESMKASFTDDDGKSKPFEMGCYGIGISRLVAAIVEASHDETGMIWPVNVAPYQIHLATIGKDVFDEGRELYEKLVDAGYDVLFDDRDEGPGFKLKDADLIGLPLRIVVSRRTLEVDSVEWKIRNEKDSELVKQSDLFAKVDKFLNKGA